MRKDEITDDAVIHVVIIVNIFRKRKKSFENSADTKKFNINTDEKSATIQLKSIIKLINRESGKGKSLKNVRYSRKLGMYRELVAEIFI